MSTGAMSDVAKGYEEDCRDQFPAVTGYGTAVSITDCPTCHALVRAVKAAAHEQWHNQQADQWHEVWTGEQR